MPQKYLKPFSLAVWFLLARSLRTARIARYKITMAIMEILTLTLILITTCISVVRGSLTDHIVTFGDSYSDNGQGFAEYARFVLQSNAVRPKGLSPFPHISILFVAYNEDGYRQAYVPDHKM